jgi:hypothetical protein
LVFFTCFLLYFVLLTMAGLTDDDEHTPPQSPRMKGIVQASVREVKKHREGIDADVQVTNERIGVLEATRLPPTPSMGQWRLPLLVSTTALLLRCGVSMTL